MIHLKSRFPTKINFPFFLRTMSHQKFRTISTVASGGRKIFVTPGGQTFSLRWCNDGHVLNNEWGAYGWRSHLCVTKKKLYSNVRLLHFAQPPFLLFSSPISLPPPPPFNILRRLLRRRRPPAPPPSHPPTSKSLFLFTSACTDRGATTLGLPNSLHTPPKSKFVTNKK